MIVVVDRIEGQLAVLEFPDRTTKDVPLTELPSDTRQGDCLNCFNDTFDLAPEETRRRKNEIETLSESLWEK